MITLRDISFGYKSSRPVLDSVDLDLKPGIIYGLLGKNGEGKTTLLKIISGLLFPDKGRCMVYGETPSDRKVSFLQHVFLLPEDSTFPEVTVDEYIKMYTPFYPAFREDILAACIEAFEINRKDRLSQMSQGQKKKAAITLALAANTSLLLMDEPTNGLDIPSKSIFRRLVSTYVGEDRTVVISTHQVRDLESLIDTVILLDNRQLLLNSSLEEIGNRLFFRLVGPEEKVLYSEPTPSGLMGVGENTANEITTVSLELLFNAAICNRQEIKKIFNL